MGRDLRRPVLRPRRPRDAWRDQAGHGDERTDASGPDMWPDDQPTSTGPSDLGEQHGDH